MRRWKTTRAYFEQFLRRGGQVYRKLYFKTTEGFDIRVESSLDNRLIAEGGTWKTVEEAAVAADQLIDADKPATNNQILADLKGSGGVLAVTFCHEDRKWAIVAGFKPWRWVDSQLRFDTEKQAREEIARCG